MTAPPPSAELFRLIGGFQVTQAIHVAATLGIADLLRAGPRDVGDLAAATDTHAGTLYRLLRALSALGVFREEAGRRFALTPMSEFLRTDTPGSLAGLANLFGRQSYWRAWEDLLHSVKTGGIAFDHAHGEGVWAYRSTRPDESAVFDRTMVGTTQRLTAAALAVGDFGRFNKLVDVGGGHGAFIADILAAYPQARGILFDQPHVAAGARGNLERLGLADRCEIAGGDFFASVPAGGDAYILKWVLHDWDDDQSVAILRACYRAMAKDATLIVIEQVIGEANALPDAKFMDLNMLVITGGIERTQAEYAALFEKAGFRLTHATPTTSPVAILEAVPV